MSPWHPPAFALAMGLIGMTVAILPITSASAAPALTRAQVNQYEQVGTRFGLAPQQVAQVYDFIDRNASVISAAAAKEKVNQAAFKAIARELGLRNFGAVSIVRTFGTDGCANPS